MKQKIFWFPSKKAIREYIQQELKDKSLMEEFPSFVLTNLIWRYHHRYSKLGVFPTRFRKGLFGPEDYRSGYNFEAYFPKLDEWKNLSWNKCLTGNSIDTTINASLRAAADDIVKRYRSKHKWCERCGLVKSEEVDHVKPEFIAIQQEAKKLVTLEEIEQAQERIENDPAYEFWLDENHPAIQYVIKAHETAVLMAVCKSCHLLNAKERKQATV